MTYFVFSIFNFFFIRNAWSVDLQNIDAIFQIIVQILYTHLHWCIWIFFCEVLLIKTQCCNHKDHSIIVLLWAIKEYWWMHHALNGPRLILHVNVTSSNVSRNDCNKTVANAAQVNISKFKLNWKRLRKRLVISEKKIHWKIQKKLC